MIDRLRNPSPGVLMVSILTCGAVAVAAFILAVAGLNQRVADTQRDSLCRFYAYQVGGMPPTTDRGRSQIARAMAEYRTLKCKPTK